MLIKGWWGEFWSKMLLWVWTRRSIFPSISAQIIHWTAQLLPRGQIPAGRVQCAVLLQGDPGSRLSPHPNTAAMLRRLGPGAPGPGGLCHQHCRSQLTALPELTGMLQVNNTTAQTYCSSDPIFTPISSQRNKSLLKSVIWMSTNHEETGNALSPQTWYK